MERWVSLGSPRLLALPAESANATRSTRRTCPATHARPNAVAIRVSSPSSTTTVAFRPKSLSWRWLTKSDTILALLTTIPATVVPVDKMVRCATHLYKLFYFDLSCSSVGVLSQTKWLKVRFHYSIDFFPTVSLGNYIMFASAMSGERPNNSLPSLNCRFVFLYDPELLATTIRYVCKIHQNVRRRNDDLIVP